MIDAHWDGSAAYCEPENKVALGFVEGLNNKIRVLQRRAYGLRDEEYLRLKVLTCMLLRSDFPSGEFRSSAPIKIAGSRRARCGNFGDPLAGQNFEPLFPLKSPHGEPPTRS